jgi:hypothetical protein
LLQAGVFRGVVPATNSTPCGPSSHFKNPSAYEKLKFFLTFEAPKGDEVNIVRYRFSQKLLKRATALNDDQRAPLNVGFDAIDHACEISRSPDFVTPPKAESKQTQADALCAHRDVSIATLLHAVVSAGGFVRADFGIAGKPGMKQRFRRAFS